MEIYVDVILPLALERVFTYAVPSHLTTNTEVGKRVLAPFGKNKYYAALVARVHDRNPEKYVPKSIISVLDTQPIVYPAQIEFWQWIAQYYVSTVGEVMSNALPSAYKLASESKVMIHPQYDGDVSNLGERELQIVQALTRQEKLTVKEIEKILGTNHAMYYVKNLIDKETVILCQEVQEKYHPRKQAFIALSDTYKDNTEALSEVLAKLENTSRTQAQADVLLLFLSQKMKNDAPYIPKNELLAHPQVKGSALGSLVKKNILVLHYLEVSRLSSFEKEKSVTDIQLSEAQNEAFNSINQSFLTHNAVLLHGVTGSGKTEIYIKLIQQTIDKGRQVLYLLPEIALTTQIINRLYVYFGDIIGVAHSNFSSQERIEIWENVMGSGKKQYKIVLGARSSIFLPFNNLGLIIIDEEHDHSYKQHDPAPRYNARDAAMILAQHHQAKILLGTATPSVETYYNAMRGKYEMVELSKRYGDLQLPTIQIIDTKKEKKRQRMRSHYSQTLLDAVDAALKKGEQVILFQNRRGFSLYLECKSCGDIPHCQNCDVTLTYHKNINKLQCHYCGYSISIPPACSQCGEIGLEMRGFGTEKIEEEIPLFLPNARIARLDYDSTRSKSAYKRILTDFAEYKTDILVGTQMVTKGLDFDNVSLVGVLNVDNMLNYPDFRSLERSFQLLMQVSGRAGRKNKQGTVLIQTSIATHPIFRYIQAGNYAHFFQTVIQYRQDLLYPPFSRLLKLTLKHKDRDKLNLAAKFFGNILRERFGKWVLGPEFPLVARTHNLYLKNILIKLPSNAQLADNKLFIRQSIEKLRLHADYRNVMVSMDVDTY